MELGVGVPQESWDTGSQGWVSQPGACSRGFGYGNLPPAEEEMGSQWHGPF